MTTPLQQAAQSMIDCWESEICSVQLLETMLAELRKALDAELAQVVEPDFYTACAEHNGGWIPLPGYSNETVSGVKSLILESARKEGWKGTIEGRLFSLCWQVMPVYLHPHHPQATTPVPEGYVLVPIEPTPAMLDAMSSSGWKYSCYKAMLAAAQGEKS